MQLSPRLIRQVVIAIVFLAVFGLLGYGTRQLTQTPPNCTDGIKNGEEEGIDCGLFACGKYCEPALEPPKVLSTKLLKVRSGDYDFIAELSNPNGEFGASEVVYELVLLNGSSEVLKQEGVLYILPGQTRFLTLISLRTAKEPRQAELKIKSAKWQKLESLEGMNFSVRRHKYSTADNGTSILEAVIFNDSDFDFNTVDVDIVLFDSGNNIIGVNRTDIRTFSARTERHFKITWPSPISKVAKIEILPSTNLFENSNFIKFYGSPTEKFQTYY